MLLSLLTALALQATSPAEVSPRAAYLDCLRMAEAEPLRAKELATRWTGQEGGAPALHCLGLAESRLGNEGAASEILERGAILAESQGLPQSAGLYREAGEAAARSGDAPRARDLVTRGLRAVRPGDTGSEVDLRMLSAQLSVAAGALNAARADLFTLTQLAPDLVEGWVMLAAAERRSGNLSGAESAIAEAAKRAPEDPAVQAEANRILLAQE